MSTILFTQVGCAGMTWKKALKENTSSGYYKFLQRHPNCQFKNSASKMLEQFKFSEIDILFLFTDFWQEDEAEARDSASKYLYKYVKEFIIPQLNQQGFIASYIGFSGYVQPQVDHAVLTIEYKELQGERYQPFGHGTKIWTTLILVEPVSLEVIYRQTLYAETSSRVEGSWANFGLSESARENLAYQFRGVTINLPKYLKK